MDWTNPLRTLARTVDIDVLHVLGRTRAALTGNQLARLAGRSYAQVSAVVDRLVGDGLVTVEQHGRTYSYQLNRSNVLAPCLLEMLAAGDRVEEQIANVAGEWARPARYIVLFGSAARREAGAESDIDILVVRDDAVPEDDTMWAQQVGELARQIEAASGNPVQILELAVSEIKEALRSDQPLIESLRRDARTMVGPDIRELLNSDASHVEE